MMNVLMQFERPLLMKDGVGPLGDWGVIACCWGVGTSWGLVNCCDSP